MIHQLNIYGLDMVQQAIKRLQTFEPPEGYYLAFSGGKDSCVIKALADMAEVKYDAHYNITTVDPPELVQFIKREHPDVSREYARYKDGSICTMWNLISRNTMPPTRIARYCCAYLKEGAGEGRFVITGVRKAESFKRSKRAGIEIANTKYGRREHIDPDNPDQEMVHFCMQHSQKILNPIIDWSDSDVWEFIHEFNVPYCELYDKGYKRLGCIGCPMAGKARIKEFEEYPKYKAAYLRSFEKMLQQRKGEVSWKTAQELFDWWMNTY